MCVSHYIDLDEKVFNRGGLRALRVPGYAARRGAVEPADGSRPSEGRKKNGTLGDSAEEEPVGVERLLGIAMGCMGMSMDNFCRCIPSEFYAAYDAWFEMHEARERGAWEWMRMQCLCSLQPYSKDKLSPRDIMRFPWEISDLSDDGKVKDEEFSGAAEGREELKERYRAAIKQAGLS